MGLFDALDTAASALTANRTWLDVVSGNLANANTTRSTNGGPYVRRQVVLEERGPQNAPGVGGMATFGEFQQAAMARGVEVSGIQEDTATPMRRVYEPGHPDADAAGYVTYPNVNPVTEMVDLIAASRAYEANTTSLNAIKTEFMRALDVLR